MSVVSRPKTVEQIQDLTQPTWHIELSHGHAGPGLVQVASVNIYSKFVFPPDFEGYGPDGEERYGEPEPFDGWRVTLNKQGLADLIERAQALHDRMPD